MRGSKFVKKIQSYRENSEFKKITSAVIHLSGEKLVKIFLGLLVQTQVARYLGPSHLGQINYVLEFSILFSLIVSFGLDEYYAKEFSIKAERCSDLIGEALGARILLAIIASFLMMICAWLLKADEPIIFFLIGASSLIIFSRIFEIFEFFFQSQLNVKTLIIARQTGYITTTFLKILSIILSWSWITFVFFNIWEYVSIRWMLFRSFLTSAKNKKLSFNKFAFLNTLSFGWPYFISSIFFFLEIRAGLFFVDRDLSPKDLGYLALTLNLIAIADFFIQIIYSSTISSIVSSRNLSIQAYRKRFISLIVLITLMCFILFVGSLFLGNIFIKILFGSEYLPVVDLLPWAVVFIYFNALKFIKYRWFVIEGHILNWMIVHSFAFVLFMGLINLYLKEHGIKMVFISVILGYLISLIFSLGNSKHREYYKFLINGS